MNLKGSDEFPIIDAYTTIIDDRLCLMCNHCDFYTDLSEEKMQQHYETDHGDLYEKTFPQKKLNKNGTAWIIPKLETITWRKLENSPEEYVLKFNDSYCVEEVPITDEEKQQVKQQVQTVQKVPIKKIAGSQPKHFAKSMKKKKRVYSYNVGKAKVEDAKRKIMEANNIPVDDIIVKPNKLGNYAIFYLK